MASSQNSEPLGHFIPHFVLRNFSHPYPQDHDDYTLKKKRIKKNGRTVIRRGEPALNILKLTDPCQEDDGDRWRLMDELMDERPLNIRTKKSGLVEIHSGMLKTMTNAMDWNYLQRKLDSLDSEASAIVRSIMSALDSGKESVTMLRTQRDSLRKYLFVIKYRFRDGLHERSGDDEVLGKLGAYMRDRGYENSGQVQFETVKAILELEMDFEGTWKDRLRSEIYPPDALWYISHMEDYFLACCTPSSSCTEFIFTDNSYIIHEGPNGPRIGISGATTTGETEMAVPWSSSYHELAPVAPKLMLVLRRRNLVLPSDGPEEAVNGQAEKTNSAEAPRAKSVLRDLPIFEPKNTYNQIPGKDGLRLHDRFTFPFFKIGPMHVHAINSVLLHNAISLDKITYNDGQKVRKTLECYLSAVTSKNGWEYKPHRLRDVVLPDNFNRADPQWLYVIRLGRLEGCFPTTWCCECGCENYSWGMGCREYSSCDKCRVWRAFQDTYG